MSTGDKSQIPAGATRILSIHSSCCGNHVLKINQENIGIWSRRWAFVWTIYGTGKTSRTALPPVPMFNQTDLNWTHL